MTSPQAEPTEAPQNSERRIFKVLLENIHPDPMQPRLHPDSELAGSIKSQGLLQPFTVEPLQVLDDVCPDCGVTFAELAAIGGQFMISDGERRWRGAKAAGLNAVDVEIVVPASEGRRLLRQVTANTGKPLTAVEQGLAYKAIMVAEGWSQADLARHLGIPRSVVGDRIRLIELDAVWLEAIGAGKLQVSHSYALSQFGAVPTEYQKKAATRFFDDYRVKRFLDGGGSIPVDEIARLLYIAFRDYIKPVAKTPGYHGPTIQVKPSEYEPKAKFAADMKLWRPCFKKFEAKRRKESPKQERARERRDLTVEKLEHLPIREVDDYHPKAGPGEVVVYKTDEGWDREFRGDPGVFLARVDQSKLTRVFAKYNTGIVTSDAAAVAAARKAHELTILAHLEPKLAEIRGAFRNPKLVAEYSILGVGTRALLSSLRRHDNPIPVISLALGIGGFGADAKSIDDLSDGQACSLASGYVAAAAGMFKVPDIDQVMHQLWEKTRRSKFKLPDPPATEVAAAPAAEEKVEKRKPGRPKKVAEPEVAAVG